MPFELGRRVIVLLLLSKEDRREFVLTRNFSSVRSTFTLCSRNKPNSSINVQWKVCDQKIGSFVSKLQSACFAFHEKASRTSEKTCGNSVYCRSYFSHAFQVLFSSLFKVNFTYIRNFPLEYAFTLATWKEMTWTHPNQSLDTLISLIILNNIRQFAAFPYS